MAILNVALCAAIGLPVDGNRILGKWRSVETSKGGIGAVLNFRPNGTFDYSPGAVIAGTYRIETSRVALRLEMMSCKQAKIRVRTAALLVPQCVHGLKE
jgi:hypothetical protein